MGLQQAGPISPMGVRKPTSPRDRYELVEDFAQRPGINADIGVTAASLTDNSGGSASQTLAVITAAAAITDSSGGVDPADDTIAAVSLDCIFSGNPTFAIDTNFDIKNTVAFEILVSGLIYTIAANTNFDTGTEATCPQGTWCGFLLSIDSDATAYCQYDDNADAGYATEALAIAAAKALTPTGEVCVGYVANQANAGGTFLAGTDALQGGTGGDVSADTNYYNAFSPQSGATGIASGLQVLAAIAQLAAKLNTTSTAVGSIKNAVASLADDLNKAIADAATVNLGVNKNFEVQGTNATSALVTYNTEGGIVLTTAGADEDQMCLVPHADTKQSAWDDMQWKAEDELAVTWYVQTPDIADVLISAGFKLTADPNDATDDEQAIFHFNPADSAYWQCVTSRGGTDTKKTLSVGPSASGEYKLEVKTGANRRVNFYIDGIRVHSTVALAASITALKPIIGIEATAVAAKALNVRGVDCSKDYT
jgi:hypothetical protein